MKSVIILVEVCKYQGTKLLSRVRLFETPWTIQSTEFSRPEYWSGWPSPSPGNLPNTGIKPRSPTLQANSLPAEPPGEPTNTAVGSLSLLQQTFPTQESNRGLWHSRQILYQLSYQRTYTQLSFFPGINVWRLELPSQEDVMLVLLAAIFPAICEVCLQLKKLS